MKNSNSTILYSAELESAVIGALLIDNDTWDDVSELLNSDLFYVQYNKIAFEELEKLLNRGQSVDILILADAIKKRVSESSGILAYLAENIHNTPTASNIVAYANELNSYYKLRQLSKLGHDLTQNATFKHKKQIDNIIAETEKRLFDIACAENKNSVINITETLETVLNKIETANSSTINGIPTGIQQIDEMTTGFQHGDFVVIAGRPGMGKTAFTLSVIKSVLESKRSPIQFYSLEMPGEQILTRFISMIGRVPMQFIRNPALMDDLDFEGISNAIRVLKEWENENRLLIDDSSYLTPQILRTRVRKNTRMYGKPAAIFIDYLQLMRYPSAQNRYDEVSRISNELKSLAKEIGCPVIALAQLNRCVEGRAIKKPTTADLRDSGAIEQDADVVILLHRDEYYTEGDSQMRGLAEIIIGKQRNGPTGTVISKFFGQYSLFETYSQPSNSSNTDIIGDIL
ncbi:replicative DNA helicase [Mergibacter septicus]|uniref:Replicative DNA helicase n=1 Tax=Mergibacter septicus TaxID=221402 RepID=A0A8D4LIN5_9PAST|nr:replicative DNA helicase [Mergibacter septicus]AWX14695.1 replicative DNA helicase [Mergibacter septicus]QDJ13946.1 replicative DNA helicase [Mergibacter septicus]UTU48604.1 replicative DNA helicase [Mergibacter septicus]WMR95767.1 replicative DNA helicase [Mergibacter septicus]